MCLGKNKIEIKNLKPFNIKKYNSIIICRKKSIEQMRIY